MIAFLAAGISSVAVPLIVKLADKTNCDCPEPDRVDLDVYSILDLLVVCTPHNSTLEGFGREAWLQIRDGSRGTVSEASWHCY